MVAIARTVRMSETYIVHGAKGSGSVAVEAALTLAASVVRRVDHEPGLARLWAERFAFAPGWEG
jgi:hypothetical protein